MNRFSLENLQSLTPIEFENLVKTLLQQMGFNATTTKISGDGGIDIIALNDQPIVSGKYIIQCKRYAIGNNIGEPPVRDLYGVMMHENANKGILITTSDFTKQAISFAQNKAIELINGDFVLTLLNEYLTESVNPFNLFQGTNVQRSSSTTMPWGCDPKVKNLFILDKRNKLMWTKNANLSGKPMSWFQALEFIGKLNINKYATYNDWRLPSLKEFETIMLYAKKRASKKNINVVLAEAGFMSVQAGYYWSSISHENPKDHVSVIGMQNSAKSDLHKNNGRSYVWPVRSGEKD